LESQVFENPGIDLCDRFLIKRCKSVSGRRAPRRAQAICTELLTDSVDKVRGRSNRRAALFSGVSGLILARPLGAPLMKPEIHPNYAEIKVICSCGNEFTTRSTLGQDLHVEVCSSCHPFYTGKQKIVDSGGRVDKFRKRYSKAAN
jgi:large subunit ribosomal protein L31